MEAGGCGDRSLMAELCPGEVVPGSGFIGEDLPVEQRGRSAQRKEFFIIQPRQEKINIVIPGNETAVSYSSQKSTVGKEISDLMFPAKIIKEAQPLKSDGLDLIKRKRFGCVMHKTISQRLFSEIFKVPLSYYCIHQIVNKNPPESTMFVLEHTLSLQQKKNPSVHLGATSGLDRGDSFCMLSVRMAANEPTVAAHTVAGSFSCSCSCACSLASSSSSSTR